MKRAIAALLLVAAVLLSGCAPHLRPRPAGQTPLAAVRNAVTAYGTPSGDGTYCLQQQKGAFVFTIAVPRENGVRSSLQMNAGALCHSFEILLDAPNGDCPCSYTVTGGDEPLRLTGRIAARAYPKAGSITVDEHGDYPAAVHALAAARHAVNAGVMRRCRFRSGLFPQLFVRILHPAVTAPIGAVFPLSTQKFSPPRPFLQ